MFEELRKAFSDMVEPKEEPVVEPVVEPVAEPVVEPDAGVDAEIDAGRMRRRRLMIDQVIGIYPPTDDESEEEDSDVEPDAGVDAEIDAGVPAEIDAGAAAVAALVAELALVEKKLEKQKVSCKARVCREDVVPE
jgi:hypothetical protein